MAGYAVIARLQGGAPRFAGWGAGAGWLAPADAAATEPWSDETAPIELVGRPLDERLADLLASLGESWSQLTFFLFDPDSWR